MHPLFTHKNNPLLPLVSAVTASCGQKQRLYNVTSADMSQYVVTSAGGYFTRSVKQYIQTTVLDPFIRSRFNQN